MHIKSLPGVLILYFYTFHYPKFENSVLCDIFLS